MEFRRLLFRSFHKDMRNSSYNIQREFYNNNPASSEFGQVITPRPADTARRYFAWVKKASHPYGHPQGYDTQGRLFSDIYAIRLAETYLLRAEPYLASNDPVNAAADINAVRGRAGETTNPRSDERPVGKEGGRKF